MFLLLLLLLLLLPTTARLYCVAFGGWIHKFEMLCI